MPARRPRPSRGLRNPTLVAAAVVGCAMAALVLVKGLRLLEPSPPAFEWDLRTGAEQALATTAEPQAQLARSASPTAPAELIATPQGKISGLALLDGVVYWSLLDAGEIYRLGVSGAPEIVAGGLDSCVLFGVVSGQVCASHRAGFSTTVSCLSPAGGGPRAVAHFDTPAVSVGAGPAVIAVAVKGGITLYERGDERRLIEGEPVVHALAVTPGWVYYSTPGAVKRASLHGGPPEVVRQAADLNVSAMTANSTHVFWAEAAPERELWRAADVGGTPEKLCWLRGLSFRIAADERFVYIAVRGGLLEVPVAGGDAKELQRVDDRVLGVAFDDTRLCWSTADDPAILCQSRPR